jgi:tRNA(Ile2) C34 agmatinyltransferase TiaS
VLGLHAFEDIKMDNPKCKICGEKTQWYGWLHGWLCIECDAKVVKAVMGKDASRQQQDNRWD